MTSLTNQLQRRRMTVEENRREKLISRLKKCLALSASPEPHEAAAALRQAQKLMREQIGRAHV